jgi:hypothetical protein
MKKTLISLLFLAISHNTFADSIAFGLTDDNFDKAKDWGFIEAAIDIDETKRIIVGGGANIGAFDADHAAYIGGEYDYPISDRLDLTARAIYIMNESFNNKALRTDWGVKYQFKKTSFYSQYRTLPNTMTDATAEGGTLDPSHEIIFGALHNFNKSFAAGMDLSKVTINKAYFKISF